MVVELLPVIGQEHDRGRPAEPAAFELAEQGTECRIVARDLGVVERQEVVSPATLVDEVAGEQGAHDLGRAEVTALDAWREALPEPCRWIVRKVRVDGVDPGPIEAADAAGSTRTQMVRWSVVPQVLPNYVAFSLYAFELNVRASTVLGFVGAGGIGIVLYSSINLFSWHEVSVILVSIFGVVLVSEYLSIKVRSKIT